MQIWYISDTHFSHANILKFEATQEDGIIYRLRPEFNSADEMDEVMITRWNERVKPSDHIWHLGDIGFNKNRLDQILPRLNGHKRLLVGNHDAFVTGFYAKYFEKIRATNVHDGIIFSHIPLHIGSLGHYKANVHGHLHNNPGHDLGLPYINISCELTNYAPISLEEVNAMITSRQIRKELKDATDQAE